MNTIYLSPISQLAEETVFRKHAVLFSCDLLNHKSMIKVYRNNLYISLLFPKYMYYTSFHVLPLNDIKGKTVPTFSVAKALTPPSSLAVRLADRAIL